MTKYQALQIKWLLVMRKINKNKENHGEQRHRHRLIELLPVLVEASDDGDDDDQAAVLEHGYAQNIDELEAKNVWQLLSPQLLDVANVVLLPAVTLYRVCARNHVLDELLPLII